MSKRERERQAKRERAVNAMTDGIRHPLRRRILAQIVESGGMKSPNELHDELAEPLTNVSYHVRMLADRGLVVEVDTVQRRGALEHYYEPTDIGRKALEVSRFADERAGEVK